jgi:hypothetical protein
MSDNSFYTQVNTVILVLGIVSGILFISSETLGMINRDSSKCKSIIEFILRFVGFVREPTLDERLAYLRSERDRISNITSNV